jgi:hypothetical protein
MENCLRKFSLIFLLTILSFLFLYSCGGQSSMYGFEYPLSVETAKSAVGNFTVAIPQGWYIAENEQFDLWLVKDDLSTTIIFQSLNLDQKTKDELLKNPASQLIEYSKMFRRGKLGDKYVDLKKDEEFRIDGKAFGAYEYIDGKGNIKRVVVFPLGNKYYESITVVKPPIQESNLDKIFSLQNSVLKSL